MKQFRSQKTQTNIVITGGTRGLGKALYTTLKKQNHNVISISRSPLSEIQCDIGNTLQMIDAFQKLEYVMPKVDILINNAAQSGGFKKFHEHDPTTLSSIIETNLIGTTISCKLMHDIMAKQETGGTIFNIQGATDAPNFAAYGASKAGVAQLTRSLQNEWKNSNVKLCLISPGMMRTELLFENMSPDIRKTINFLCAEPEEVAEELTPQILKTYYDGTTNKITYFTIMRALTKLPKVF